MNLSWIALNLASLCTGGLGAGCHLDPGLHPPPDCQPPDGGPRCSCPGTSFQALDCAEVFVCRQDGTWAPYDASCLTMSSEAGSIPSDAGAADATGEPGEQ
jgi:hypothetical protein